MGFLFILAQLFVILGTAGRNSSTRDTDLVIIVFVCFVIDMIWWGKKSARGGHSSGNYTYTSDSRQESFDRGYMAGRDMVGDIYENNSDFMTGFYAGDYDRRHDI